MIYSVDICQYMYRYYITYDRLFTLNKKAFYGKTEAVTANIFIDIRSFIDPLIKRTDIRFEYKDNQTPIASAILNLAIHLRDYYRTRHNTDTKIYLVWGANIVSGAKQYTNYNAVNNMAFAVNHEMRTILQNSLELLKVLCPYLPQIYYVDCGAQETSLAIQALIDVPTKSNIYTGVPNIIYSRDPYACQLVANNSYTFMFYCSKSRDGLDESFIVEKENIYDAYRYMNKYSNRNTSDPSIAFFGMTISLSGMKCRNIKGGLTFNNACKLLAKYSYLIPVTPECDSSLLTYVLMDQPLSKKEMNAIYSKEMSAIDNELNINIAKTYFYNSIEFITLFDGCVDLYSPEDVKKINDRYFINYPIDVMRL